MQTFQQFIKENIDEEDTSEKAFINLLYKFYPHGLDAYHETDIEAGKQIQQNGFHDDMSVFAAIGKPSNFIIVPQKAIVKIHIPVKYYNWICPDMPYGTSSDGEYIDMFQNFVNQHKDNLAGTYISIASVPKQWIKEIKYVNDIVKETFEKVLAESVILPPIRNIPNGGKQESLDTLKASMIIDEFCNENKDINYYDIESKGNVLNFSNPEDSKWGHIATLRQDKNGYYVEFLDCKNSCICGVGPISDEKIASNLFYVLMADIQKYENYKKNNIVKETFKNILNENQGTKIVAAAYKDKTTGKIYTGRSHMSIISNLDRQNIPIENAYNYISGFITDTGYFLNRKEAADFVNPELEEFDSAYLEFLDPQKVKKVNESKISSFKNFLGQPVLTQKETLHTNFKVPTKDERVTPAVIPAIRIKRTGQVFIGTDPIKFEEIKRRLRKFGKNSIESGVVKKSIFYILKESKEPKQIVAAAIRFADGSVFTGDVHCMIDAPDEKFVEFDNEYEVGFLTNNDQFITRDELAKIVFGVDDGDRVGMENIDTVNDILLHHQIKESTTESVDEKIVKAAIKLLSGKIYTGSCHLYAMQNILADDKLSDNEILNLDKAIDGFITNKGRFVDKDEACKIAGPEYDEFHSHNILAKESTNLSVYHYQDAHGEKHVHGNAGLGEWEAGEFRYRLENAGDILRELSKYPEDGWFSKDYIMEKINKLKHFLKNNPKEYSQHSHNLGDTERIKGLIKAYESQPTNTPEQELARRLVIEIALENFNSARVILSQIENFVYQKKFIIKESKNIKKEVIKN